MNTFGLNIILAIAWVAFTGSVSLVGLITGFVIGYGALWLIQPLIGTSTYFRRVTAWVKLVIMFHYELIVSSFAVAMDVLTPKHRARPAIIEVPLDVKTDTGILLVTNLISLTPGTLIDAKRTPKLSGPKAQTGRSISVHPKRSSDKTF